MPPKPHIKAAVMYRVVSDNAISEAAIRFIPVVISRNPDISTENKPGIGSCKMIFAAIENIII